MIKRFPCILFVSDAAHFWYVAALKIGSLVAHSVAVSPVTLTLGFFLSLKGLIFYLFFIYFPMFCFTVFKANGEGSVSRVWKGNRRRTAQIFRRKENC